MFRTLVIVAGVLAVLPPLLAEGEPKKEAIDPIAVELRKAKEDHQSALETATAKLLNAFAEQQKKLETNSNIKVDQLIKLVDQLQEQKKAFEADHTKLPTAPSMKVSVSDYLTKIAAGKSKCEKAFDKAAEAYRASKDLATAKAVLAEKVAFLSGVAIAPPVEEKWTPLFNGRDLAGWIPVGRGQFSVKDKLILGKGPSSYLMTKRNDYENFHLRVEALVTAGSDAGLLFRNKNSRENLPPGYEVQISDVRTGTGSIIALHGDSANELVVVSDATTPEAWFTLEVIAKGNSFVVKIDGKEVSSYVDDKKLYGKGHISLQAHSDNCEVKFRRVEIRELPATK